MRVDLLSELQNHPAIGFTSQHAKRLTISSLVIAFLLCVVSQALPISNRTLIAPIGEAPGDNFGQGALAGDLNGDGFDDVIVGAHRNDAGGYWAGRAYVFWGGPGADDIPDLVLTGEAERDYFGYGFASGDFNGDGSDDVLVGGYWHDAGRGRVYAYFGGPAVDDVPDLILDGEEPQDRFGRAVASGDVNGDGFTDIIVAAHTNDAGGTDAGRVYIYFAGPGVDTIADMIFTSATVGEFFGQSVASAGDVNGDGAADIIVGANNNDAAGTDAGRAYLFYGGSGTDDVPDLVLTGEAAGDQFGFSVSSAGDFNADSFSDLVVGAIYNDAGGNWAGRAYVFYGGPGADTVADIVLTGEAADDRFGYSAASAGDVNGDGFDDMMVGAIASDAAGYNAGRAYVYFGDSSPDEVPDLVLDGEAANDNFGRVASGGDFNADGFGDVLIAAVGSDAGGTDSGKTYVIAIYPYQVLSPDGGETWEAGTEVTVHWLGHDVADVGLSTDGGLTWDTLASGVGGEDENIVEIVAPPTPTELALIGVSYAGQPVTGGTSDVSDDFFSIVLPEPGSIEGHVLADCPLPDTPLFGVTLGGFDAGTGELVESGVTGEDGSYEIPDVPVGDYIVSIATPLGYLAPVEDIAVTVMTGPNPGIDFALECLTGDSDPRSRGYWKHQVARIIRNIEHNQSKPTDFTPEEMMGFLGLIEEHFADNPVNQVTLYEAPDATTMVDSLRALRKILAAKKHDFPEPEKRVRKAKGHLMAILANVVSGKIAQFGEISQDGATVSQAITYAWHGLTGEIICSTEEEDEDEDSEPESCRCLHKRIEKILKRINHGKIVKAGLIPLDTPNISYEEPDVPYAPISPVTAFSGVAPSPFKESSTVRFQLAEAAPVVVRIHSASGRLVRELIREQMPAGYHRVAWNGRDDHGRPVAQGVYYISLVTKNYRGTKRVVVLR